MPRTATAAPALARSARRWALVLAGASLLCACAMPRLIDSQVQSFTGARPALAGASFRFERLPSQTTAAGQDALEAMAGQALVGVGLKPATADALYTATVGFQVIQYPRSPYAGPPMGGFFGADRRFFGSGFGITVEPPWYRHAVHLLLRDVGTQQPVYETSAQFDGPWSDSARLLPVLLQAALQGYPHPPSGPRTVVIEVPADGDRP